MISLAALSLEGSSGAFSASGIDNVLLAYLTVMALCDITYTTVI
jgi:hypothetical protein